MRGRLGAWRRRAASCTQDLAELGGRARCSGISLAFLWLVLEVGGSLELGFLALLSPCLSDSAGKASGVTPQGTLLAPSG